MSSDGLPVRCAAEVSGAMARGAGVVALESTIFSRLGLPDPHGREALRRCVEAVRAGGAVPALTAVLDGVCRLGVEPDEHERVLSGNVKVAERDLAVAAAQCWPVGVTTVSAALALAARAGVSVLTTGGIGGVHRGAEHSGDISADLDALATRPLVTVSAGAKAFLDLARTLQRLETLGVPVLGWGQDEFPAFYTRSSGLAVSQRVQGPGEVARVLRFRPHEQRGVLLAVPIPAAHEIDQDEIDAAMTDAVESSEQDGVTGSHVTPDILSRVDILTDGRSVAANLALAENNARVAGAVATWLAGESPGAMST